MEAADLVGMRPWPLYCTRSRIPSTLRVYFLLKIGASYLMVVLGALGFYIVY